MAGIQALCTEANCDYKYIEAAGEVSTIAIDAATYVATITGTELPVEGQFTFGSASCNFVESATTCTFTTPNWPAASTALLNVVGPNGLIPHGTGVVALDFTAISVSAIVVNGLTTTSEAARTGGATVTFIGQGFDTATMTNNVVKTGEDSVCTVTSVTSIQLVCTFLAFLTPATTPQTIAVTVNGNVLTYSDPSIGPVSIDIEAEYVNSAASFLPTIVSPVLHT